MQSSALGQGVRVASLRGVVQGSAHGSVGAEGCMASNGMGWGEAASPEKSVLRGKCANQQSIGCVGGSKTPIKDCVTG